MTVKREKPILSLPILLPLLTVEYQFLNRKRKELWTQISFVHRLRETRKLILPVKSWRFRNGEENFRLEFLIKKKKIIAYSQLIFLLKIRRDLNGLTWSRLTIAR